MIEVTRYDLEFSKWYPLHDENGLIFNTKKILLQRPLLILPPPMAHFLTIGVTIIQDFHNRQVPHDEYWEIVGRLTDIKFQHYFHNIEISKPDHNLEIFLTSFEIISLWHLRSTRGDNTIRLLQLSGLRKWQRKTHECQVQS